VKDKPLSLSHRHYGSSDFAAIYWGNHYRFGARCGFRVFTLDKEGELITIDLTKLSPNFI
jgi:hypothetical protein